MKEVCREIMQSKLNQDTWDTIGRAKVFSVLIQEWALGVRIEPDLAKPLFVDGLFLDWILCVTMMLR